MTVDQVVDELPRLFTTRGHETWAGAASAALKKADKMAWEVVNRVLVLRRIAAEG